MEDRVSASTKWMFSSPGIPKTCVTPSFSRHLTSRSATLAAGSACDWLIGSPWRRVLSAPGSGPLEVQEVRHPHEPQQAATDPTDVLAMGVVHDLWIGELVLTPVRDDAHRAVRQCVSHPLRVAAVGEGEAEAVLGRKDVDRRPVHRAGPPAYVDDDAESGRPGGHVDRDLVGDGTVEARHAPAQPRPVRRGTWARTRLGGVWTHTKVSPPSTARTWPVM